MQSIIRIINNMKKNKGRQKKKIVEIIIPSQFKKKQSTLDFSVLIQSILMYSYELRHHQTR